MPFTENAFASPEAAEYLRVKSVEHARLRNVLEMSVRQVMRYLGAIEAETARDYLVWALAARVVSYSQAAERAAIAGMKAPANALVRCAMEAIFSQIALVRAKENYRRIRLKYLLERRRVLKWCIKWHQGVDAMGRNVEGDLKSVDGKIRRFRKRNRDVPVSEIARRAGMSREYETRYALYSTGVHPDPWALLRDHVANDEIGLVFEPEDDCLLLLSEVVEILAKSALGLANHFRLPMDGYLQLRREIEHEFA